MYCVITFFVAPRPPPHECDSLPPQHATPRTVSLRQRSIRTELGHPQRHVCLERDVRSMAKRRRQERDRRLPAYPMLKGVVAATTGKPVHGTGLEDVRCTAVCRHANTHVNPLPTDGTDIQYVADRIRPRPGVLPESSPESVLEDLVSADRYRLLGMKRVCQSMVRLSAESCLQVRFRCVSAWDELPRSQFPVPHVMCSVCKQNLTCFIPVKAGI